MTLMLDQVRGSLPPVVFQWGERKTVEFRPQRAFWLHRILTSEIGWTFFSLDVAEQQICKSTAAGGLFSEYFNPVCLAPRFSGVLVSPDLPLRLELMAPPVPDAVRRFFTHGRRCYSGGWYVSRLLGRKWPGLPYGMSWRTTPHGRFLVVDPFAPMPRISFQGEVA